MRGKVSNAVNARKETNERSGDSDVINKELFGSVTHWKKKVQSSVLMDCQRNFEARTAAPGAFVVPSDISQIPTNCVNCGEA
jgi:hypothetical protein